MEAIRGFHGEFRWLSNFWPAPVWFAGLEFPTVENAYQAAKCADSNDRAAFVPLTPGQAKRMGRTVAIRDDWDQAKIRTMTELLEQKFQIPELKEKLLATGDRPIIEENEWGDTFWGVCRGRGDNRLGELLMNIRSALTPPKLTDIRVLVCGGRDFNHVQFLDRVLDKVHAVRRIACIIEGDARGADRLAKQWAVMHNVPLETYPAQWDTFGKRAGYLRNEQMLTEGKPELVIAFPGGKGTANMITLAKTAGVAVWEPQP